MLDGTLGGHALGVRALFCGQKGSVMKPISHCLFILSLFILTLQPIVAEETNTIFSLASEQCQGLSDSEARKVLEEAKSDLIQNPCNTQAFVRVAILYSRLDAVDAGVTWYKKQIQNTSEMIEGLEALLIVSLRSQKLTLQKVIKEWEYILSVTNVSEDAKRRTLSLLTSSCQSLGDHERVTKYGLQLLASSTNEVDQVVALGALGKTYIYQKEYFTDNACAKRIIEISPGDTEAYFISGFALKEMGLTTEACDKFFTLGQLYLKNNEKENTLLAVDLIKSCDPASFLAPKLLSMVYEADNQDVQAQKWSGTGWMCGRDYIVTCNHVIQGCEKITVSTTSGETYSVNVVASDPANDMAILKSTLHLTAVPLSVASAKPRLGDKVFTIGYPLTDILGKEPKFTDGTISAITGIRDDSRILQISVPVQPGNSGGPLFNESGEVIGIVSHQLSAAKLFQWNETLPQNINYAVKIPYLKILADNNGIELTSRTATTETKNMQQLAGQLKNSIVLIMAE